MNFILLYCIRVNNYYRLKGCKLFTKIQFIEDESNNQSQKRKRLKIVSRIVLRVSFVKYRSENKHDTVPCVVCTYCVAILYVIIISIQASLA